MIAVVSPKVKYLSAEKKPIVPQKRAIDLKSWIFKNFVFEISPIVGKKISRIIINWPKYLAHTIWKIGKSFVRIFAKTSIVGKQKTVTNINKNPICTSEILLLKNCIFLIYLKCVII